MLPLDACGVIMAGGMSRRMGTNKALLDLDGRPLIGRVADQFGRWFRQTVLVTNTPDLYDSLGLEMASDRQPGLGPVAGIEAGLRASRFHAAFFAACDMPFLSYDLVAHMVALAAEADVVVPIVAGQYESMHAVYTRSCLPAVSNSLDAGVLKVIRFYDQVRVRQVPEVEWSRFGPADRLFFNCNTPEDFARAQALLHEADSR